MTRGAPFYVSVLLAAWSALGCATHATPPDKTPVYEDPIAPGVEPIAVERMSVNSPEPAVVDTSALVPTSPAPGKGTPSAPITEPTEEPPTNEPPATTPGATPPEGPTSTPTAGGAARTPSATPPQPAEKKSESAAPAQ